MRDKLLKGFKDEIRKRYKCHTLILYGSRARGDETAASDYDLLAFRKSGRLVHDARKIGTAYLDAFIYSERQAKPAELLRARGGLVLFQENGFGDRFLKKLDHLYARGPKRLPKDEIAARIVWAQKMLERAKRGDLEGNFRRVWLLTALLEDYFALRGIWYEGPKRGFSWLQIHDPKTAALFDRALRPSAKISAVEALACAVIST
jgi:hypothetical protein